jgi:hypothetical protein
MNNEPDSPQLSWFAAGTRKFHAGGRRSGLTANAHKAYYRGAAGALSDFGLSGCSFKSSSTM